MKSYTDLEQSKKLAELLPIESADMCCFQNPNGSINYYGFPFLQGNKDSNPIPCWSLAALRACLPSGINIDGILYVFESHNTFYNEWVYEYKFEDISAPLYSKSSNEIDACYEMILKLHEQKFL